MKSVPWENPRTDQVGTDRRVILYVEDDRQNREVAEYRLGRKFEIHTAADDKEACDKLRALKDRIFIVLMDIELQNSIVDGIELAKLIRGQHVDNVLPSYTRSLPVLSCPILFVTAYGDRYHKEDLLRAGASEVIRKPIDFVDLELAITKYQLSQGQP